MADQFDAVASRQIAATSLRTFMRFIRGAARSVILMDVLGCSLKEICEVMDCSLPAAKAALHRGRAQLRELMKSGVRRNSDYRMPIARASASMSRISTRDFDAIRAMISDDVRLDLVNRTQMRGKAEVFSYFSNYAKFSDWRLIPGLVEDILPSWCSIRARQVQGRNTSCCWAGPPARSQPSRIFVMRRTQIDGAEYSV